jgi:hypothetical protein
MAKELKSKGYMLGVNVATKHCFSFGMGLVAEIVYFNLDWEKLPSIGYLFQF